MVILGLGSNIGDRLTHLRQARNMLARIPKLRLIKVSPLYLSDALLPEQAPSAWNQPYLNLAILCETPLEPHELLQQIKNVEYAIGRKPPIRHWGPRVLDIDILAWDNRQINDDNLRIPHLHLPERPFALWPLADLLPNWVYPTAGSYQGKTAAEICAPWGSRFSGEAPLHTRQIYHRIDTPILMGALNLTPDSFSDGGQFSQIKIALRQAYHLVNTGAEIIDLGAEATNPQAIPLHPEDEWERLEPILDAIQSERRYMFIAPRLSIDTRHVEVAEKALARGVDWINDPSGLEDPKMRELIAACRRDCVVMHNLGVPADKNRVLDAQLNPVEVVYRWGETRLAELEKSGIPREKIIFDPGIGFGKHAEHSFELLKNTEAFKPLGTRLLIGHSRKSFMNIFTNKTPLERDLETAILAIHLTKQGVDYLRVHDTEICSRSLKLAMALN